MPLSPAERSLLRHAALTLGVLGLLTGLATYADRRLEEQLLSTLAQKLRAAAALSASGLDSAGLDAVDGPEDMTSPAYRRARAHLGRVRDADPDFRYAYIVRHIEGHRWAFVADVDDADVDLNQDGRISADEEATLPGQPLDASHFNAPLLAALKQPGVDMNPVPDPPWGVNISGYAPLCPETPEAPCGRMVLGIDMRLSTALATVERIRSSLYVLAFALTGLIVVSTNLWLRARTALRRSARLQKQLIAAKVQLSKFVPDTVRRLIDDNPDNPSLEKAPRELAVMFLDLAGYTRLSEAMPRAEMNHLIESYFSAFLDVIREHNGDINETAGDGLMALFLTEDASAHARDAARCALAIQRRTQELNQRFAGSFPEVTINIGVTRGAALVGSTRFEGTSGARLTFTATGPVTNLAARLADLATEGTILVSEAVAEQVRDADGMQVEALGPQRLKNIDEPTPVFRLRSA